MRLNSFPNDKFYALPNSKSLHTTISNLIKKKKKKGRKVSKKEEKHCGKRRNCSLRAISPFTTVFSKDLFCRHVKTRACLGKD